MVSHIMGQINDEQRKRMAGSETSHAGANGRKARPIPDWHKTQYI
jgi:hypothetical protein